jgi:hypothetical protein
MKTYNKRNKKYLAKTCKKFRKNTKGGNENRNENDISSYVFRTNQISTQPNTDNTYKEIGVIHLSESVGVNIARGFITGLANTFGKKGFENILYDNVRNDALKLLQQKLTSTQKVSNIRMDVEGNVDLIYVHIYGTLLEKIKTQN